MFYGRMPQFPDSTALLLKCETVFLCRQLCDVEPSVELQASILEENVLPQEALPGRLKRREHRVALSSLEQQDADEVASAACDQELSDGAGLTKAFLQPRSEGAFAGEDHQRLLQLERQSLLIDQYPRLNPRPYPRRSAIQGIASEPHLKLFAEPLVPTVTVAADAREPTCHVRRYSCVRIGLTTVSDRGACHSAFIMRRSPHYREARR